MNWERLTRNVGWRVQLIPIACRLEDDGRELPSEDDDWVVEGIGKDWIEIRNDRTSHVAKLGKDHIHNFTSNPARDHGTLKFGFLTLTVQIFIQGRNLRVRPTKPGGPARSPESSMEPTLRTLLIDQRFTRVCEDYRRRGSPKFMIDTFTDLSPEEKADLYERACLWKNQRLPRDNPYRK